jgi:hypothetical protein
MQPTQNTPDERATKPLAAADPATMSEADFRAWCAKQDDRLAHSYGEWQRDAYLACHEAKDVTERTDADAAEVAQTLRDVRLYLSRHGWNQGEYYDATSGRFTPPACLVGAVGIVCYGGPVDAPAQMFEDPGFGSFELAVGFLDLYTSARFGLNVYDYNDAKGRTVTEVLAVLDRAAQAATDGLFPMCCDRFMPLDGDDPIVVFGCLADDEPYTATWHRCSTCGYVSYVVCKDPDVRTGLVAAYRQRAAAAKHTGPSHEPGRSDDCTACDSFCYCTAEFTCINHAEGDGADAEPCGDVAADWSDLDEDAVWWPVDGGAR